MIYIIYHDKCTDGFGAAWVAWQKFKEKAVYIALNHYDPVPNFLPNSEIFLLDFCFDKPTLELLSQEHKITVLDHHQSAYKSVASLILKPIENLKLKFNLKKSGAEMAWDYWFPNQPLPELINYIKDRDLGLFELEKTQLIISALMTIPKEFHIWEGLSVDTLYLQGKIINDVQNQLMKEMVEKHHFAEIGGHLVPVVNATAWWSDITRLLLDKYPDIPFAAAYYALDESRIKWSLRSRENSSVDVAEISSLYKGGGHAHSGGFTDENHIIKFYSQEQIKVKKAS